MTRKRTIWAVLLAFALTGAAGLASLNHNADPGPPHPTGKTANAKTVSGSEKLIGRWKLVRVSVTPDFLNVPIPINTFDAMGSVANDYTYTIEANGSFFGSNYGYLGNGDIDVQGNNLTLTINEGVITVNEKKKKHDRKGRRINGTYRITNQDTLHVKAVKYQDGISYTFDLALVNS